MEEKTLKAYEISYLLRSEEGKDVLISQLKRLGAEILFESETRNLKLTYPIHHSTTAYFGYIHFELDPEAIKDLNNALKLDNQIVRFLIITPPFVNEKSEKVEKEIKVAKPKIEPVAERAASNDLLEEKLEEILNK